jgi:TusA-related sulfurtransferase
MGIRRLDISGKTSPYCLLVVEREAKALSQSGELFITCDNFPAVTTLIPRIAREAGLSIETTSSKDGHWEIRLARKNN